jgi:hypothetical protein
MDARVVRRTSSLFSTDPVGIESNEFSLSENSDTESVQSPWQWPLRTSSAERAILEALDELPKSESFHTIDVTFESLVSLRPKLLTTLLAKCRSVKVKRLFFVYADKHAHAWREHIDMSKIEMGRGDRALAPGGRLHPAYRITVPADLIPSETNHAA